MKRVNKESTPVGELPRQIDISAVKYREKDEDQGKRSRPTSIAERLKDLQGSKETWRDRVEEKDVSQFTVEGKLTATGQLTYYINISTSKLIFCHCFLLSLNEFLI